MRLLLMLLLGGCTYNVPISKFDVDCDHPPPEIVLVTSSDPDFLYHYCGDSAGCIYDDVIFAPAGPDCERVLAHELNHYQGNHWVDGVNHGKHRL